MLTRGRKVAFVDKWIVRGVITVAAVGLFFLTAAAFVVVTYKREAVEERLGIGIANSLYGVCDRAYEAFMDRRRALIDSTAKVSKRFKVGRPASPITADEEAEVIDFIELAFGWNVPSDATFTVSFSDDGSAIFQPYQRNMDQITIDECGYLKGDDYAARQRLAEHFRKK
jgi:hypothetical protein